MTDADATRRARRIAVLAETALVQVEATRRAIEDLLAEIGERAEPAAPPAPVVPLEAAPRAPESGLESARLMAIEMAVAGRSREEVARQVRAVYELSDVEALLDDVFGPAGLRRSAPGDP